jgi:type II secretory ATPase GspE/PulE/Tfp pilus assembly ATPase PilB-like protein
MAKFSFETSKKAVTDTAQMRSAADDKGVVQRVDEVIQQAVQQGATEIHFEPHAEGLIVRTRVKGALQAFDIDIPEGSVTNVINRVKVLSGMDITRTKIPQSGFFKVTLEDGRKIELYSYVFPTLYGEATIISVQYKQSATLRLPQLGMTQNVLAGFQKALARGSGLYLITGPPGSGKRTTAYASILEVLTDDKLAIGWDPVIKYEIPGMIQAKPDDKTEFSFAEGIQALLKQEPDVAYIGEIAGLDDARAAIQGAFAKRYVICRMTANDCVNALQNILDMGVQSFLVAASLAAIVNQRLLRKLCPKCRQPYDADQNIQKEIGIRLREGTKFYHASGCDACEGTGFNGVQVVFELFLPSEELNKMIVAKEQVQALRQQAVKEGMATLKMDGIFKAMHGLVTVEDVLNSL